MLSAGYLDEQLLMNSKWCYSSDAKCSFSAHWLSCAVELQHDAVMMKVLATAHRACKNALTVYVTSHYGLSLHSSVAIVNVVLGALAWPLL